MKAERVFNLKVTGPQMNVIATALGKEPYVKVAVLMNLLSEQAKKQEDEMNKSAEKGAEKTLKCRDDGQKPGG